MRLRKSIARDIVESSKVKHPGSLLMQLPLELRERILFYLVVSRTPLSPSTHRFNIDTSRSRQACGYRLAKPHRLDLEVLRTCKQMYREGTKLLVGNNTVDIVVSAYDVDILGYRIRSNAYCAPTHRAFADSRRFKNFNLIVKFESLVTTKRCREMLSPILEGANVNTYLYEFDFQGQPILTNCDDKPNYKVCKPDTTPWVLPHLRNMWCRCVLAAQQMHTFARYPILKLHAERALQRLMDAVNRQDERDFRDLVFTLQCFFDTRLARRLAEDFGIPAEFDPSSPRHCASDCLFPSLMSSIARLSNRQLGILGHRC